MRKKTIEGIKCIVVLIVMGILCLLGIAAVAYGIYASVRWFHYIWSSDMPLWAKLFFTRN